MPELIEENLIFDKNINADRKKRKRRLKLVFLFLTLALFTVLALLIVYTVKDLAKAPSNFPVNTNIEVANGLNVRQITNLLQQEGVVKSNLLLYVVFLLKYDPSQIKASNYYFDTPLDVYQIADKLVAGDFKAGLLKLTHIEGESVHDVGVRASTILENFDINEFNTLAKPLEGKLFPETYLVPKKFTATELIATMQAEYEKNIAPLRTAIASSQYSEEQVIILASIIEREANSPESMKMVAGIIENRLKLKMPLQVDASIEYILDKPLSELTSKDLEMDSPYNTYKNKGLPPTAIGNPGLTAIKAVLEPTKTDNLFYVTGDDGEFHYSKTFEEHKKNVARYLK